MALKSKRERIFSSNSHNIYIFQSYNCNYEYNVMNIGEAKDFIATGPNRCDVVVWDSTRGQSKARHKVADESMFTQDLVENG